MFINPVNKNSVINRGEKVPKQDIFQTLNRSLNWQGLNDNVAAAGNPWMTGIMSALQSGMNTYDRFKTNEGELEEQQRKNVINKEIANSLSGKNFARAAALSAAEGLANDAIQYSSLGNQRDIQLMNHNAASAKELKEDEEKRNKYLAEKEEGSQLLTETNNAINSLNNNYGQSGGWFSGSGLRRYIDSNAEEERAKTLAIAARVSRYMTSGVAASQMGSDEEGRRALGVLASPSSATSSELKSALEYAQKFIRDRQGVNAIKMGYDPNKEVVGGYTTGIGSNQIKNAVDLAAKRRQQLMSR